MEAHLGGLFEEEQGEHDRFAGGPARLPSAEDADLRERNAARKAWISRDGAQDRSFRNP